MTLQSEIPNCRLHLRLNEGPDMLWLGHLQPAPPEFPNFSQMTVGQWYAPASSAASVLLEANSNENLRIDVSVRFLSQLRHCLLREPGDVLPVALDPLTQSGPVLAGIEKRHLESIIEATETRYQLGPRTRHFSPPVYLQEFWGRPRWRPYGKLDNTIADLNFPTK